MAQGWEPAVLGHLWVTWAGVLQPSRVPPVGMAIRGGLEGRLLV